MIALDSRRKDVAMKALAAGLALLSSPALVCAAPAQAAPAQSNARANEAGAEETLGTGTDKVICKREKVLGSRVTAKRVCQTVAEWERQRREDQQMAEKIQGARWKGS